MTIRAYTGRPNPRDALANAGRPKPVSLAAFTKSMGLDDLQAGQGMDGGMPIRMGGPGRSPSTPEKKKGGLASMLGGPMGGAVMQGLGDAMMMYALTLAGGDQAEAMSSVLGRRDQLNAAQGEQQRYEGEQDYQRERDTKTDEQWQKDYDFNAQTQADKRAADERKAKQDELKMIADARKDAQAQQNWDADHKLSVIEAQLNAANMAADNARQDATIQREIDAQNRITDLLNAVVTQAGLPPVGGAQPTSGPGLAPMMAMPPPQPASASAAEAPPMQQPAAPAPMGAPAQPSLDLSKPNPSVGMALIATGDKGAMEIGKRIMEGPEQPLFESEYDKKVGGDLADTRKTIYGKARKAQGDIAKFDLALRALDTEGVYTGAFGGTVLDLKRGLQALGGNPEGVAETELIGALGTHAVMEMRAQTDSGTGVGLPGSVAAKELSFLIDSSFGLTKSARGNRLLLEMSKRTRQRDIDMAKFLTEYEAAHGGRLDTNFEGALWQEFGNKPLMSEEEKREVETLANPRAQTTPAGSGGGGRTKTWRFTPEGNLQ